MSTIIKGDHFKCESCALRKQHREEFSVQENRRKREILELVHTDVCGPMQTKSLGGAYYFLIFIDDIIRYTWVYFTRNKSDMFEFFKEFKSMVESKHQRALKFFNQIKVVSTLQVLLSNIVNKMELCNNLLYHIHLNKME